MHEAGIVAAALETALEAAALGSVRRLELDVVDPVELSVESVLMHLRIALRRHGLAGVPVVVHVAPVRCVACGVADVPQAGQPFCASCGWPLPHIEGEPLRINVAAS